MQVGDKAEMLFLAGDQHAVDEMNAVGAGTGRIGATFVAAGDNYVGVGR